MNAYMSTTPVPCRYCKTYNTVNVKYEGYELIHCTECQRPFVVHLRLIPEFKVLGVEGCADIPTIPSPKEIEDDAKYYSEHPEELEETICNDAEQTPVSCEQNTDGMNKCSKCGLAYEDHGITNGICPVCFLDEDSVKGIRADSIPPEIPFRSIPGQHVQYRIKSGLVEIKYRDNKQVVLSRDEIYLLFKETDRIPAITALLGKVGNKPKITGVNIFLKHMDEGLIPEFPNTKSDDDDADFKPMLSSVVNTRCNYDGSKIGGWS